jgi:hypothetical protein
LVLLLATVVPDHSFDAVIADVEAECTGVGRQLADQRLEAWRCFNMLAGTRRVVVVVCSLGVMKFSLRRAYCTW